MALTYAYQWKTSPNADLSSSSNATGSGAATNIYAPVTGDLSVYVFCAVTATGGSSSATAVSAPVFIAITPIVPTNPVLIWIGTIPSSLTNGQLDTTLWPYQSVTPGHLAVLSDPLGTDGTVIEFAITESG